MCVVAGKDTAMMVSNPVSPIPGTLYPIGEAADMAIDSERNLYVVDAHGNRILKVSPDSTLVVFAGTGRCDALYDGTPASQATLCLPTAIELRGRELYFVEQLAHCIRKIDLNTERIYTVAGRCYQSGYMDGSISSALFFFPTAMRFHPQRNLLFVTDIGNNRVRFVDLDAQVVGTIAGNGTAGFCGDGGSPRNACLNYPVSVLPDPTGTKLWIGDGANLRVREVDLVQDTIRTIIGNGTSLLVDGALGTETGLWYPTGLAWDPVRNKLWVGPGGKVLLTYDPATRRVQHEFGVGGGYFGDYGNYGDFMDRSQIRIPTWNNSIRWDPFGYGIYAGFNRNLRYFIPGFGSIPVVGPSNDQYDTTEPTPSSQALLGYPWALTGSLYSKLWISDYIRGKIYLLQGGVISPFAEVTGPFRLAWDKVRRKLYVASVADYTIYAISEDTREKEVLAGVPGVSGYSGDGGPATLATLGSPGGLWLTPSGDLLYLSDALNHCIRVVDLNATPPTISRVAGMCGVSGYADGDTNSARFRYPSALVGDGSYLYIAEAYTGMLGLDNFTIRKLGLTGAQAGMIVTAAGVPGVPGHCVSGGPALSTPIAPYSIAFDPSGRLVIGNYTRILVLDEQAGMLSWLGPNPEIDCGHPAFFGSGALLSEGWLGEVIAGLVVDEDRSLLLTNHQATKVVRIADPW
jgi:DNA-binding beta-propeller fold protein YncE